MFHLCSYFGFPKGPWPLEAGLRPDEGPLGDWPGLPQSANDPVEAQSMNKI